MNTCQGSGLMGSPASGPLTWGRRSMKPHRLSAGKNVCPTLVVSFVLKRLGESAEPSVNSDLE